jgi:uncharacterized membrane protein YraQ (UPF0718 family)
MPATRPAPALAVPQSLRRRLRTLGSTDVLALVLVGAVLAHALLPAVWRVPAVQAWTTVFAAVCIQASPYVVLGVTVSVAVAAVPASWLARALPRRRLLAVPVAALAGCAMPGCECGSVPVATAMLRRGIAAGPAFSLMLAAPAINPIVLAATASAFPGRPDMVLARFAGSFVLSVAVGWVWSLRSPPALTSPATRHEHGREPGALAAAAAHDLAQSLGLLTIGAASAASIGVLLPRSVFTVLAGSAIGGVATLAVLAVVLAVCSEADAFIASSFVQFSRTAQLVFMVVGPAVDVKLLAMQVGAFGGRLALRLGLLAFGLAVPIAVAASALT